jgi:carbamate kinase
MKSASHKEILLVALGGNALIKKGQAGTIEEQLENLRVPIRQIARLSRDYRIIITHGNGPQVGNLLLQQESCAAVPKMPLEILVEQTQGQIGYMIESTLDSELMKTGVGDKYLVSLISYVVVDEKDPAFLEPSKPIGPVYSEKDVERVSFPVRRTPKGYRRVVASPSRNDRGKARDKKLIDMDFIVICCGGGYPVIREGRAFRSRCRDRQGSGQRQAGRGGEVDIFIIATDVPGAALSFGLPEQQFLRSMTWKRPPAILPKDISFRVPWGQGEASVQFMRAAERELSSHPLMTLKKLSQAGRELKLSDLVNDLSIPHAPQNTGIAPENGLPSTDNALLRTFVV